MPNINVQVKNKIAHQTNMEIIVCGNSDYSVVFDFDAEWSAYNTKTMRVQIENNYTDVVFTGNTASLPVIQNTYGIKVGVFAGSLHTTTPAYIDAVKSILCKSGTPVTPTPSVYEQIMTALNGKGDGLSYADNVLKLMSGQTVLAQVTIESGEVEIEMRVSNGYLQYKVNDGEWQNAIAISTLLAGYATEQWVGQQGYLTEHQSLAAYRTSAAQDIIDSGKQATISDLATIREGAALGATALQEHQSLAAYRTSAAQDIIDSAIAADVDAIEAKIPAQATEQNQLADRSFVNSSINSVTAYYITKTAAGAQFATHAELAAATTFYSGGEVRVPTRNDYCIVQSDENHENATTRYIYQNSQWEFQYVVNETALTSDQLAALNSGITSNLVSGYNSHVANTGIHVTSAEKATWNGKQDAIPENTYDAYGAARTAILGHNAAANAHSSLFASKESTANKVTSLSSASTDTQYPSAKCVYDLVGNIEATLQAIRGV